ncbi:glucosamine-6-phosphate deaminase [Paenibacillus piri]|uniref:Glucosamine-6-phosphate deaminase n=1 Tax=Paenibacillus piri TaxID=2547395 RepID=A0A4R5KE44_9BACL|nr:glucosamine-6-phosphate deaminase [Paenibacillus piri]TDF93212.1 glucosamine-6-phosphate deaminase [Paenibacillus piri]
MNVKILRNAEELGQEAASLAANLLKGTIAQKGRARLVLSTGASQFETLQALVHTDVDWSKVEMFHLDEYVNLSESHPASFRKYLKERFVDSVPLQMAHFVNGEGNIDEHIAVLTREIRKEPIDLALIGIGENAHIAFNDPPADFETEAAYIVVQLDEACKRQQVGEGWFASLEEVPKQAITMTVHQIMQCKTIISCVPHKVKARAIRHFFASEVTREIPATILKSHPDYTLFLDRQSASEAELFGKE